MSRKKNKNKDKLQNGWERALAEAENQVKMRQRKIYELRKTITIFREKIASGEPWPLDDAIQPPSEKAATQ